MADLPAGVTFLTVSGKLTKAVADTADAGVNPDSVALSGQVTFKPEIGRRGYSGELLSGGRITLATGVPPLIVVVDPVPVALAADGSFSVTLVDPKNPLIAPSNWSWTVDFSSVVGAKIQNFAFNSPAASQVLDLAAVVPVEVSTGSAVVIGPAGPVGPTGPTGPAGAAGGLQNWAATTAYTAGQKVVSPGNDVVSALAAFTSGAAYVASNWQASSTFAGLQPQVPRVPAAPVSLESPYDIAGTGVHPDVVYVPAGWGADGNAKAWKYWMTYTPYWRAKAEFENPCIQVSDDGLTWVTPAGLVNPLDPDPVGVAINSDPDMLIVAGTLYLFYRQHDATANTEQIMLRTSTTGIAWSAETTVIDTAPLIPGNRLQIISPAVIHDGTQFVMYHSKDAVLQRRTSADALTWSAPAACGLTGGLSGATVSHIDAIMVGTGVHLLVQDSGGVASTQNTVGARKLWLAKSINGIAFTVGTLPLLISEHLAQRMIYRTCGLWESRNGKDFYRLWVSGVSYSVGSDSADLVDQVAGQGYMESYYIGYSEGYDPNDPAVSDKTSLYPSGDVVAGGRVRGDEVGGNRVFGRFIVGAKGWFDRLRAVEVRAQAAFFEGPIRALSATPAMSEWAGRFGYTATNQMPPLVLSSPVDRTYADGSTAALDFINQASDQTKTNVNNRWRLEERQDGKMVLRWFNAGTQSYTNVLTVDPSTGAVFFAQSGGPVAVAGALNVTGNVAGAAVVALSTYIGIRTAGTPATAASGAGTVGDIMRDDNYLYCKTSTGWKRAALTTW